MPNGTGLRRPPEHRRLTTLERGLPRATADPSDDAETILSADHPALQEGWNDAERSGAAMWRWTDGAATIPWDNITGSAVVTVRCTPVDQYPVYDETLALVA